jgi:integrase
MKIRYFNKRETIWIDFRMPDGARKRLDTKCPIGQDKEAEKAAAGLVSKALAAAALPNAPAIATVAQPRTGWTLKDAFKEGLRTRERWMQAKDANDIQQRYEACAAYWGPDRDLGACTRAAVMDWREAMRKMPGRRKDTFLSNSTINHRLSMLSVLLEVANLPPHTVKHLSVKDNGRKRRPRREEIEAMHAWMLAHHHVAGATSFSDMIESGLQTAARQSELLGVEWSDVYFDRKTVCFRDTKNGESREIPLTEHLVQMWTRRKEAGLKGPFADLTQDRCQTLWERARAAIGLADDPEFVFHVVTRHESLSRIGDAGGSAYLVKAIGGHKSIQTSSRYVKPEVESLRARLEQVSAYGIINQQAPAQS